jgi:hypothetical protein
MIKLKNVQTRLCPGNVLTHHVQLVKTKKIPTQYFSLPLIKSDGESLKEYAMIVVSNETLTKTIMEQLGEDYEYDNVPLFIPRNIADIMRMPLVTILNNFCDISTKEEVWQVHFYLPKGFSTQQYRQYLAEI